MSTMYRQMRWLCLLVIVMLVLAACGGQVIEDAAPAAEGGGDAAAAEPAAEGAAAEEAAPAADAAELPEVPRERTLIIMAGEMNQYTLFDNQNPYIPGSNNGFHSGTLPAVFEPLIMFDVLTGEYENWLLEDWEYLSDTEISLTVRDGVTWNDGEPFTTEDIKFTFDMALENAGGMVHLADLPEYYESSEIVDDKTIILKLSKPNPAFWATTLTTNHGIHVLPKHIWEGQNPLEFTNFDIAAGWPRWYRPVQDGLCFAPAESL
ncbi:MAG: ABC transporter substrate-binding protein [Caldilineaceae bacterium]